MEKYSRRMQLWILMIYAFVAMLVCFVLGFLCMGLLGMRESSLLIVQWLQTFLVMMLVPVLWFRNVGMRGWQEGKPSWRSIFSVMCLDSVNWKWLFMTLCLMICVYPVFDMLQVVGFKLPMPDGLRSYLMNEMTSGTQQVGMFIASNAWYDVIGQILLLCVATGIGEEMMFRGALTHCLSIGHSSRSLKVALVVGFIFAVIHMELYGLMPRWILGSLFVYLLWWSKSLWTPILAHALNNLSALIEYKMSTPEELACPPVEFRFDAWIYVLSTVVSALILWKMWRMSEKS